MAPLVSGYKFVRPWRLVFVALLLIVGWLALQPVAGTPHFPYQDKALHALAYAALYGVGWLAYGRRALSLPVHLSLLLYGLGIEWLQSRTGYRFAEWTDVVANILGQGLGNLAVWLYLLGRKGP
jgi:hypothetical protein